MMSLLERLLHQFKKPEGKMGRIAGFLMEREYEKSDWTISLLNPGSTDRVLEVGFGPGRSIESLSQKVTEGYIAGIDISEVMVTMAEKRNRKAVSEGRVDLYLANVSSLPPFEGKFDHILSVNSLMFWDQPVDALKNLRNHLKPNGKIAITVHPRMKGATDETAAEFGEEIDGHLKEAGFSDNQLHLKKMKPVACVCVTAVNKPENP